MVISLVEIKYRIWKKSGRKENTSGRNQVQINGRNLVEINYNLVEIITSQINDSMKKMSKDNGRKELVNFQG